MRRMNKLAALLLCLAVGATVAPLSRAGEREGAEHRRLTMQRNESREREGRQREREHREREHRRNRPAPTPRPLGTPVPKPTSGPSATPRPTVPPPVPAPTPRPTAAPTPGPVVVPTPAPALDGTALYNQSCAGCHGNAKKGTPAATIQNAINANRGGMGSLRYLTPAQITAISQAK